MAKYRRFLTIAFLLTITTCAHACEPVLPFIMTVSPTLAFTGSLLMLALAVAVKSVLFAFFERRLPHVRAALLMFLGNVLTSIVGILVAAMLGSGAAIMIGIPIVCALCWLPSRRLVKASPLPWLGKMNPLALAAMMTLSLLASVIFFSVAQGAIYSHRLVVYWAIKLVAIFCALSASVSLTVIWEEWVVWRLAPERDGKQFFTSVLRTNLYVLVLVLGIAAAMILPRRLKSPDFLVKRPGKVVAQANAPVH